MQRMILSFLLSSGFALLSTGLVVAQESETKVKLKNLPPTVQKTVQEQSQGAKIRGLAKETEKGQTYYEVELLVKGHGKDVLIDPTGKVVAIEEEIALNDAPAAVKAALTKQTGKGRLTKLETITKNSTLEYYEARIKTGLKTREVKVDPEGKVIP